VSSPFLYGSGDDITIFTKKTRNMEIIGNIDLESLNFEENLLPLFEAMKEGKTIHSVTCCAGEINKNSEEKDFTIENFKAMNYFVSMQSNHDGSKKFDWVTTDQEGKSNQHKGTFYMNWVKSFTI
jgi:hypothetical protein